MRWMPCGVRSWSPSGELAVSVGHLLADEFLMFSRAIPQEAELVAETPPSGSPFWMMTLSAGEHAARATIEWAEECLEVLDRLDDRTPDAVTGQ